MKKVNRTKSKPRKSKKSRSTRHRNVRGINKTKTMNRNMTRHRTRQRTRHRTSHRTRQRTRQRTRHRTRNKYQDGGLSLKQSWSKFKADREKRSMIKEFFNHIRILLNEYLKYIRDKMSDPCQKVILKILDLKKKMSGKARKRVSIKTTKKMITQIKEAIEIIKSFHGNGCAVANPEIHNFLEQKIDVLNVLIRKHPSVDDGEAEEFIQDLEEAANVNPVTYDSGEVTISEEDKKKLEKLAAKEKKRREVAGETMQNEMEMLREYLNENITFTQTYDHVCKIIFKGENKEIFQLSREIDINFIKETLEDLCMEYIFERKEELVGDLEHNINVGNDSNGILNQLIGGWSEKLKEKLKKFEKNTKKQSLEYLNPENLYGRWTEIFESSYWIPGDNKKDLIVFLKQMNSDFVHSQQGMGFIGEIISMYNLMGKKFHVQGGGSHQSQGEELKEFYIQLADYLLRVQEFGETGEREKELEILKGRMEKYKGKLRPRYLFFHFIIWIFNQFIDISPKQLDEFMKSLLTFSRQVDIIIQYGQWRKILFDGFKLYNLEWRQDDEILEQIRNRYSDSWLWNIAVKYAKTNKVFDSFLDTQIENYLGNDRGYSDKFKTNLKMIIKYNGDGGDEVAKIAKELFSGVVILYLLDDGEGERRRRETIKGFIEEKFKEIIPILLKKLKYFEEVFTSVYPRGKSPEFDTDFFIELYVYIHYTFDNDLYEGFVFELDVPNDLYKFLQIVRGEGVRHRPDRTSEIKTLELLNLNPENIFYRDEEVNEQDKKALKYCIAHLMGLQAIKSKAIKNYVIEVDALGKINPIIKDIKKNESRRVALLLRNRVASKPRNKEYTEPLEPLESPVPGYEGPGKYKVIEKASVRDNPNDKEKEIGEFSKGTIINVVQHQESGGYLWLRTRDFVPGKRKGGWVKFRTAGKLGFGRKQLLEFVSGI